MSNRRPWRAVAYERDWTSPTGVREVGRNSARTEGALARWTDAQQVLGRTVRTWEVLALAEIGVTPEEPADLPDPAPTQR